MKYAVLKSGGKQYKVKEGDTIIVDKVNSDKNKEVAFENVLLLVSDSGVKLGNPTVSGLEVKGKIVEDFKGEKVRVAKFKSKVRYRRVIGFRPMLSKVKIEKIE